MVKVVVPPAVEPVLPAELKTYLRYGQTTTQQDSMMEMLLTAGREEAEKYQNAAYCEQTLQIALDAPTSGAIVLPRPPFKSLESVIYYDTNDIQTDITDLFAVNDIAWPVEIKLRDGQTWPNATPRNQNPIVITYKSGSTDVPNKVKLAILFYASWFFMHPDAEKIPEAFYSLLKKGRVIPV